MLILTCQPAICFMCYYVSQKLSAIKCKLALRYELNTEKIYLSVIINLFFIDLYDRAKLLLSISYKHSVISHFTGCFIFHLYKTVT